MHLNAVLYIKDVSSIHDVYSVACIGVATLEQ